MARTKLLPSAIVSDLQPPTLGENDEENASLVARAYWRGAQLEFSRDLSTP
jgi:hypothetical protein